MKTFLFILVAATMSVFARPADITLTDGRVLTDATVTAHTPRHVTIRHGAGLTSVAKELLPADLLSRFPLDEAAAAEADRTAALARQSADAARTAEAQRITLLRAEREAHVAANDALAAEEAAKKAAELESVKRSAQFLIEDYFSHKYVWAPAAARTTEVTILEARPVEGWAGRWLLTGRAVTRQYSNNSASVISRPATYSSPKTAGSVNLNSPDPSPARSDAHRHRHHDDCDFTVETRNFEATYSTSGTTPTVDVTVR